jgi:uncharacterized protein YyaL (SSP411 family)
MGDAAAIAAEHDITTEEVESILSNCRTQLLQVRAQRIRPGLDHKILLGWNALMQSACLLAYRATGEAAWYQLAERNMQYLLENLRDDQGKWRHVCTDGKKAGQAFLDDRAYLIRSMIDWQAATGQWHWMEQARELLSDTIEQFGDSDSPFFYFTARSAPDVILRKKEIYDGALPSPNAVMAENLLRLGIVFDQADWQERSEQMVAALGQALLRYPGSFGYWGRVLSMQIKGLTEVVIFGPEATEWMKVAGNVYLPGSAFLVLTHPVPELARFSAADQFIRTSVQVCRKTTCLPPVNSPNELLISLKNIDFSE